MCQYKCLGNRNTVSNTKTKMFFISNLRGFKFILVTSFFQRLQLQELKKMVTDYLEVFPKYEHNERNKKTYLNILNYRSVLTF